MSFIIFECQSFGALTRKKKKETLAFLESRCSTFIYITFRCGRIRPAAPLVALAPEAKSTAARSAVQGKRLAIRTIGDF